MMGTMPYTPVYAGFFRRLVAFIIDSVLFYIVFSALIFLARGPITFESVDRGETNGLMWIMLVAVCLYSALMEGSPFQATLGKLAMGIRVTNMDGRRLSFANAFARSGAKLLSVMFLGLGCLPAAFTPKRQALHDFPTGCLVVRKGSTRESVSAPNGLTPGNVSVPNAAYDQLQAQLQMRRRAVGIAEQVTPNNGNVIKEWDTGGALVKATFVNAPARISAVFHQALAEGLTKAGIPLQQASDGTQIQISGHFVLIDQGSRVLRYFSTGIAGKARVEVEGGLMVNGEYIANLHVQAKVGLAFVALGGDNQKMLTMCAANCGLKIAKQVAAALNAPQRKGPV